MSEYIPDRIFAPSAAIHTVADEGNTPFFLYDHQGILNGIQAVHSAFSWAPEHMNFFPLRENPNPHILKILQAAGTGISVCNYAELCLAERCGFSGSRLLYEPSRKDSRAEELAHRLHALWLLNGMDLLPDKLPHSIILRYHPYKERLTAVQFPRIGKSKNGLDRTHILDALSQLRDRGAEHLGLSLQVASYNIQPGFWEKKTSVLLSLAQEIKTKLCMDIRWLMIGEGPGMAYHPRLTAPTIGEEADKVRCCMEGCTDMPAPVILTGASKQLMEHSGILITKILEKRTHFRTSLILDAGMCQFLRPALKQAYRHISVLGKNQTEGRRLYTLAGPLPDETDRLTTGCHMLPEVQPGEYCVVHDVGCGARSMPLLYAMEPVAAEFLYEPDGTIRQIAPARTPEEVMDFLTAW